MYDREITKAKANQKPTTSTFQTKQNKATMSTLSELSIQLRKLQSTNNAQTAEIDRLNRQARILSDLQGVSVYDIKDALKAACEGEAHEELRAEVGRLKDKLDCFEKNGSPNVTNTKNGVKSQEEFDAEAASRARTNLELRVGELEELEGTLRKELATVYSKAQELAVRNTALETQHAQQQNVIDEWERRWKDNEAENKTRENMIAKPVGSVGSYNYSEFATESVAHGTNQSVQLLLNDPQSTLDMKQQLLAAETALAGEKQQNNLLRQQIEASQKSNELKLDQNQHRIQFQAGQIVDLEQQLSSLYAAFGIVQQERTEERDQKLWLKRNLLASDAALAQNAEEKERCSGCPVSANSGSYSLQSYNISNPFEARNTPLKSEPNRPSPTKTPAIAQGYLLLALPGKDSSKSKSTRTIFSPRKLISKSKSNRAVHSPPPLSEPKFRKLYCQLHGSNGLYQFCYGELYGAVEGVLEFITTGVSSVEHTVRSASIRYGFEITINPNVADSPSICCAAETEEDYMLWMTTLTAVIDGSHVDHVPPPGAFNGDAE